ncbi:MAG: CocE/NonD family hydrolase [Planctomycetota bacterium]
MTQRITWLSRDFFPGSEARGSGAVLLRTLTVQRLRPRLVAAVVAAALAGCASQGPQRALQPKPDAARSDLDKRYQKREHLIPMRDGVKLFTAVYSPKDEAKPHPILMFRTPYSCGPYGEDKFPPMSALAQRYAAENFIFVCQDVRGRFMSEGEFDNMRPHLAKKESPSQIDESSDTYDTIDWLVKTVPHNSGRVGIWGISYPGYYAAAGMIDAHPALKAVSPQAPIADWYYDDFHHHGALFLPHTFNFFATFGKPRPAPTKEWGKRFDHGTPDGYQFFLDLGSLKNADEKYFHGEIAFWNQAMQHPDYDDFWRSRNILPHLHKVAPAVMVVGGWFDAEDLYGPLKIYRSVEEKNPGVTNTLVMGPWRHGGWGRSDGDKLGKARFGSKTSEFYRESIEFPFFNCQLNGVCGPPLPEAYVFETGANRWRTFDHWPPTGLSEGNIYLQPGGKLSFDGPPTGDTNPGFDEYISDPNKPVPYTEAVSTGMTVEYMTDDQRFAARRPDVLAYQTDPLEKDVTLAGPIMAEFWVSTSGTDSDWVVKLIDVFPPDASDPEGAEEGWRLGGAQTMVRSEVLRGRYRNSYEKPEPFVPNEPALIRLELLDVLHTFQKGHRVMVQVQSSWFPLVDRNPQKFVENVNFAEESDFIRATQRVYASPERPSRLRVGLLTATEDPVTQSSATRLGSSTLGGGH